MGKFKIIKSLFITGFLFAFLLGCSQGQDPVKNRVGHALPPVQIAQYAEKLPGVLSINISPHNPQSSQNLMVLVQEKMAGRLGPTLHYQWLKNGKEIPGISFGNLPMEYFDKGDLISVRVSNPNGSDKDASVTSKAVRILNTPPKVVSASFVLAQARSNKPIEVEVQGADQDNDSLDYFYRWFKNNQEISGEISSILETAHFKRGDRIYVEVKGFDGEDQGTAYISSPITILNSPPNIISNPPFSLGDNGKYQYHIEAEDPDGDTTFFELVKGPKGMLVDSQKGFLIWEPSPDDIGTHFIEIAAVDPNGAKGKQNYDLQIFNIEAKLR